MKTGNPIQFVWSKIGNFKIDGNKITADVLQFEPTLFKWMSFLTGYVLPKAYYEKVGAEGFEARRRSAPAPTWSTSSSATPSCASRPTRTTGAASRPSRP